MRRILIIKMWALGDILMATPLLTALRRQCPDVKITWVADTQYADLLENHPMIDELIRLDSGRWRRLLRRGKILAWLAEARRLRREMQRRRFDAVINCHPELWWTRTLCAAPLCVGVFPGFRLPLLRHLYTHPLARVAEGARHNTDHYLQAVKALGLSGPFDKRMIFSVSPQDQEEAALFLREQPTYQPDLPLLVLHPGASQTSKCWLPEHFAAVAARLSQRYNIVITGSANERILAEAIWAALPPGLTPPMIAAGGLDNVRVTAALVQQAAAVVTGDTATLHIASALGTPLVAIYGSTRPADNAPLFGPRVLLYDDRVPCAPCYKSHCPLKGRDYLRCQRAVTPSQALAALGTLLEKKK